MTATLGRTHVGLALLAALALSMLPAKQVLADDTGDVLGAFAAGYVTYDILSRLENLERSLHDRSPYCRQCYYPRYVLPEYDLHAYRFRYPPSPLYRYRQYQYPLSATYSSRHQRRSSRR